MKEYVKPSMDCIDLRTEERIAVCEYAGSCPDDTGKCEDKWYGLNS